MIAIALDDEPIALEVIRSHASRVPFIDLKAVFTDAFKAMEYLKSEPVDLLFLDIKMPDISGIDFLHSLPKKPLVVFTTAYSEHAVTSFELDAVDYLLKPFSLPRFIKACNKVQELHEARNKTSAQPYIFLKTGYEQVKVLFDDIYYLEAAGNYVNFVMKERSVLSRMTFTEVEIMLPEHKFVRVHRSYLVAIDHIDRIERHQVHVHGTPVPVGESYTDRLKLSRP